MPSVKVSPSALDAEHHGVYFRPVDARPRVVAASLSLACGLYAACGSVEVARADDAACVAEHARGRDLRDQGKLRAARDAWRACSIETCPSIVRDDCTDRGREADASIPTLVVRAVRPDGNDESDLRLTVDGARMTQREGRALELDPGRHQIHVAAPGMRPERRTLTLVAGEKNRVVVIDLTPAQPARRAASRSPREPEVMDTGYAPPIAGVVFASLATAACTTAVYFAVSGRAKENDFASCAPHCTEEAYESMFRDYIVADALFAAAVVSAAVATGFFASDAVTRNAGGSVEIGTTGTSLVARGRF
jgi:hypothetical protein